MGTEAEEEIVETEKEVDNVSDDIEAAIKELEGKAEEPVEKEKEQVEEVKEVVIPAAPQSLNEAERAEWPNLTDRAREIIIRREQDFHKAITNQDSERLFGRDLKEVITPYIPNITAAGSTPARTVQNLLNTAYRLQTGDTAAKTAIVREIANSYGVDINSLVDSQEYTDPTIQQLQMKIQQMERMLDPNTQKSFLQEQLESAKVQSEIEAFASNPEHVHYEQVKPLMVALLNSKQASGLKDAYDMACMANPTVRSMIEAKKSAEEQSKRKQEIEAKRRAASSVAGSPAVSVNKAQNNSKSTVEDDLRAAFDALENRV